MFGKKTSLCGGGFFFFLGGPENKALGVSAPVDTMVTSTDNELAENLKWLGYDYWFSGQN